MHSLVSLRAWSSGSCHIVRQNSIGGINAQIQTVVPTQAPPAPRARAEVVICSKFACSTFPPVARILQRNRTRYLCSKLLEPAVLLY